MSIRAPRLSAPAAFGSASLSAGSALPGLPAIKEEYAWQTMANTSAVGASSSLPPATAWGAAQSNVVVAAANEHYGRGLMAPPSLFDAAAALPNGPGQVALTSSPAPAQMALTSSPAPALLGSAYGQSFSARGQSFANNEPQPPPLNATANTDYGRGLLGPLRFDFSQCPATQMPQPPQLMPPSIGVDCSTPFGAAPSSDMGQPPEMAFPSTQPSQPFSSPQSFPHPSTTTMATSYAQPQRQFSQPESAHIPANYAPNEFQGTAPAAPPLDNSSMQSPAPAYTNSGEVPGVQNGRHMCQEDDISHVRQDFSEIHHAELSYDGEVEHMQAPQPHSQREAMLQGHVKELLEEQEFLRKQLEDMRSMIKPRNGTASEMYQEPGPDQFYPDHPQRGVAPRTMSGYSQQAPYHSQSHMDQHGRFVQFNDQAEIAPNSPIQLPPDFRYKQNAHDVAQGSQEAVSGDAHHISHLGFHTTRGASSQIQHDPNGSLGAAPERALAHLGYDTTRLIDPLADLWAAATAKGARATERALKGWSGPLKVFGTC